MRHPARSLRALAFMLLPLLGALDALGARAETAPHPAKIVVVTVDGLSPGSELVPARLPALAELAHRAARYSMAWSPSPLAYPSIVAVLTGAGPAVSGVRDEATRGPKAGTLTLAGALAKRGYRGAAFPGDLLEHARGGLERGFERWSARSPALADSERIDSTLAWLASPGRRFAWVGLTLGAPAEPWRRIDGIGPRAPAALAAREHVVDRALGRLLRALASGPDSSRTLVVIAGTGWPAASLASAARSPIRPVVFRVTLVSNLPLDAGAAPVRALGGSYGLTGIAAALMRATGEANPGFADIPPGDVPGTALADEFAPELSRSFGPPDSADVALARWRELRALLDTLDAAPDTLLLERLHQLAVRAGDSPRLTVEYALARARFGAEGQPSRDLKALIEHRPDYPEAVIAYSDHLLRHRRAEVMLATLAKVAPGSPLGAVAAWRTVVALAALARFSEASVAAAHALELGVPSTGALGAPDTLRRLDDLARAVNAAPREPGPRFAYAASLAGFELFDAAYEQLHAARALTPGSGEADLRLAELLLRQGRTANAIATLRRALTTEPGLRAAHLLLADALIESGARAEARHELEQALSADPRAPRAQFNLACLLATDGERDPALAALERALDQGYDDWDQLASDPDLASLRADPRFQALLARRH